METLLIDKKEAIKLHKSASASDKKLLEKMFGKAAFEKNIFERLGGIDDLWKISGSRPEETLSFPKPKTGKQRAHNAIDIVWLATEVINEGWIADYNNPNQKKWWPYFRWNGSAFVFSDSDCVYDYADSVCGARLAFETKEKSDHIGKTFEKTFNEFLTIKK